MLKKKKKPEIQTKHVMEYYMNRCWLNNVCVSRGLAEQCLLSARSLSCNGPMAIIKLRQPIQLLQL